MIKEEVIFE
jgi:hypothetical protein